MRVWRGVLERGGDVCRVLAVRGGHRTQRLTWQLLPQLRHRDADSLSRGIEVATESTWTAGATGAATLRTNLGHLLVDARVDLLLFGRRLGGGDLTVGDGLIDARVRGILERGGDVRGGLAVRGRDVGEGLGGQLLLELRHRNPDDRRRGAQVLSTTRTTGTVRSTATWPESTASGQSGVGARLADGRLERRGADAETLGQRIDERLEVGLARRCAGCRRRGWRRLRRRNANRGAAEQQHGATRGEAAFEGKETIETLGLLGDLPLKCWRAETALQHKLGALYWRTLGSYGARVKCG